MEMPKNVEINYGPATRKDEEEILPAQEELLAKLEEAEKAAAQNQEKYLRVLAELDNYKKRMEREKKEQAKFSNEQILKDLLPFMESLRLAIEHASQAGDIKKIEDGLRMIQTQLGCCLERHGMAEIEALGKDFDPNLHEALIHSESESHRPNEIMAEIEKGYLLHGRLLKPSRVSVCKGRASRKNHQNPGEAANFCDRPTTKEE
jgi:molecular chaperone GrpE